MLVKVSNLKPGDSFIWADGGTRALMIANEHRRSGVLELVRQLPEKRQFVFWDPYDKPEGDRANKRGDNLLPGQRQFNYSSDSAAYLVDPVGPSFKRPSCVDFSLGCVRCGTTYGDHFGLVCPSDGIFMPDQLDAPFVTEDDWLAMELGL